MDDDAVSYELDALRMAKAIHAHLEPEVRAGRFTVEAVKAALTQAMVAEAARSVRARKAAKTDEA